MPEPERASIALSFGSGTPVTPPQADVLDLFVHLGCSKEVSSFEIKLQNWAKKYSVGGTYPITVGMNGSISLGRGANCPLLMTCKVENVRAISNPQEHYIVISGRCWGEKLFRKTVTVTYTGLKGEAIVKDLIDYYVGLNHNRSGTELIEDTDTTYAKLEYTDSPVWDILKYIAETADKNGVIGFDFRVAPDGKFEFFPKTTKFSEHYLTDAIDGEATYEKDIVRIRNKITIKGLADKSLPTNKVSWTRSLTPTEGDWQAGSGTLSLDATGAPDGGACIKNNVAGALYFSSCLLMLDADKTVNAELYPTLDFQVKLDASYSGTGQIILMDNTSKTAVKKISISPDGEFHASEIAVGSAYVNQWDSIQSDFDWTHVQEIMFYFWFAQSAGSGAFWVHGLYFGGIRYSAIAQDAASQNAYTDGQPREYSETDEELVSDSECDLRAKALLAYLKDPAERIHIVSTLFDFTTTPTLAADMQHIFLPNENVDDYFRIEYIEYRVPEEDPTVLETTIQLGKEPPQLADYLYGLRTFTVNVEKLSRTKLGKKGVPVTAMGGGGNSASSIFTSNVEIDKVSPVVNFLTGRTLKACVGFDSVNFFLVSYTGDLILRAQSQLVRPYADGSDDLGNASFRFNKLYLKDSFYHAGFEILTNNRLLQNVTADAAIIVSGQLGIGRVPRGGAGYVLEAQGANFDPMYVDPNGRFAPAGHGHAAGDVTSGTVDEARLPTVFAGALTFNGGLTASDYKSSYGNSGLTTLITYLKDLAGATGMLTFQNGLLTGAT